MTLERLQAGKVTPGPERAHRALDAMLTVREQLGINARGALGEASRAIRCQLDYRRERSSRG